MSVHIANIALELTTSGNNTAGETYILTCTPIGDKINAEFQWLRHDHGMNETISNSSTTVSTMKSSFVSQLVFNPLQASHGGNVECQARIKLDSMIVKQFNIVVNGMNSEFTSLRLSYYKMLPLYSS